MRRVLLIGALALLAPASLAPAAVAPAASVKLVECVPALDPPERTATFDARVGQARGSARMQVRFTLQVSEGVLPGWRRVVAPGLDQWLSSDPGVTRYSYSKTVRNLSAPAAYRTVVRFRWLDADGELLKRARSTSRVCRQPDMRPDIGATRIEVAPAPETGAWRYAVTLHNDGRTDAAAFFAVALRVGDEPLDPLALPGLAAGEREVLTFTGPACVPGDPLTVTVDGEDAVDERDEGDNVLVASCLP